MKTKDPRTMTQTIFPPAGGWKPHTLYLVDVSMDACNPMHKALFYSGFLHDGWPAGYNGVTSIVPSSHSTPREITGIYYLKVIKELHNHDTLECQGLPPKAEDQRRDPIADMIDRRFEVLLSKMPVDVGGYTILGVRKPACGEVFVGPGSLDLHVCLAASDHSIKALHLDSREVRIIQSDVVAVLKRKKQ